MIKIKDYQTLSKYQYYYDIIKVNSPDTFVRPILIPATTDIKITAVTVGATMAVRSVMEGYLLSGSYK